MKIIYFGIAAICSALRVIADQDTLYFSPQPEDVTAVEGYNATLRCGASKSENIVFYWTLDGKTVENNTRRYMIGSNLHISRVSPLYDIGEFKCIVKNVTSGRSIVSRGAQINILWITDIVMVVPPKVSDFSSENPVVLRCKADGNPEPQITWYLNGARLYRDERISFESNQLHITNATSDDFGIYSCKATNDVGSVDSNQNYALRMLVEGSPHIVTVPKDVIARENTSAFFDCSYENVASITWIFEEDTHIANSSRHTIYSNGTLEVSSVGEEDEGFYKCIGMSLDPEQFSDQVYAVQLKLASLEEFSEGSLQPQPDNGQSVVTVHDSYDITCLAPKGIPRPKMWWRHPNGDVINDSGRIYVEDMRLIFSEVQKSDSGNYTCVAENIAGQDEISFTLFVSVAPIIEKHPVDTMVNEGESARLECKYSNSSSATVAWLKDDMYVKDTGNHISLKELNGTLIIRNVGPQDAGSYHCEVRSKGFPTVHSKSATLSVKEKLKFIPSPVNRKLELSSNAKIYCKAGGSTPPVVKWTKLDSSLEWPPHIKDDNGTLHFNGVLRTDTGKYMCIATNSQGIINATIDVDVIVMPKFSVLPSDTVANEGDPVILHCLAEGDPLPVIQWDKNNELNGFSQMRFKVLDNGSLYASEVHVDDEGKYGCTAGNSGGLRRHEVSLIIKSKQYNINRTGPDGFANEGESTMTKTVAITLGAAGVYIILVISLMMWCRYRRARRKALMLAQATTDAENSEVVHDMELKERAPPKTQCNDVNSVQENMGVAKSPNLSKLHFPRENLATVMLLGHGEFGQVFLAKATGLMESNSETVVMVKALESKEEHLITEFKNEMSMYLNMKHENVGTVLRVCQDASPTYVIMDYTDWGDLKQFLLATRPEENTKCPKQSPLSLPQNLMICQQVAVGMEYIEKKSFVHKDLASRNCLISSSLKIKISCPCLSLDTYSQEYYHSKSKIIPLRWAPAESVLDDNWSTKSDVWSFAVLVWEVFNKAELPFSDISNEDVMKKLQAGENELHIPEDAPENLVKLLEKCFYQDPKDRPSFSEVVAVFVELSVAVQM